MKPSYLDDRIYNVSKQTDLELLALSADFPWPLGHQGNSIILRPFQI